MYSNSDKERVADLGLREGIENEEYRSPFRRDYARLIHSTCFRRLQGKTQLYPGLESDFFRNRLTHSLEVAQISKSLAIRINNRFKDDKQKLLKIDPDLCEFAGLAHDLGHPPFGHQGEEALDECMRDFGGFEGNAQTLRILTKIEKREHNYDQTLKGKEYRLGLNLTFRSLASILKYDVCIPIRQEDRAAKDKFKPIKGYYKSESPIVKQIKQKVIGDLGSQTFKSIECQIMDIADDIAYSTYDLEDALKAGFYHPLDMAFPDEELVVRIANKVSNNISKKLNTNEIREVLQEIFKEVFSIQFEGKINNLKKASKESVNALAMQLARIYYKASLDLANNGYLRADFTSKLVGEFIRGIVVKYNKKYPSLSLVLLEDKIRLKVEVLKTYTFESQILSSRLKVAEFRGKEIVKEIFKAISNNNGWSLMPEDYQKLYHHFNKVEDKMRIISDFIAGMTDRYAIEFYGRLKSENPETIFKPL